MFLFNSFIPSLIGPLLPSLCVYIFHTLFKKKKKDIHIQSFSQSEVSMFPHSRSCFSPHSNHQFSPPHSYLLYFPPALFFCNFSCPPLVPVCSGFPFFLLFLFQGLLANTRETSFLMHDVLDLCLHCGHEYYLKLVKNWRNISLFSEICYTAFLPLSGSYTQQLTAKIKKNKPINFPNHLSWLMDQLLAMSLNVFRNAVLLHSQPWLKQQPTCNLHPTFILLKSFQCT